MLAVFLDRDGVINQNREDHVKSWDEFRFLPGALEALQLLTRHGFRIFVVTNQACVHRGLITVAELEAIHRRMGRAAQLGGASITDIRYCPHCPEEGCQCRKPQPGMLLDLALTHDVNLGETYMVGDALTDVAAGQSAGCQTILVRTGRGAEQLARDEPSACQPDVITSNLLSAAMWLCGRKGARSGSPDTHDITPFVRYRRRVSTTGTEEFTSPC